MKYLFALLSLPFCIAAAAQDPAEQLAQLASAGNGVIKLDSTTFDILTSPKRTWSVSVQLTALDKRRKCVPCKSVNPVINSPFLVLNSWTDREFDPSWNAVAEAWTKVPKKHRDNHFFATLDFDNGQTVFQKVCVWVLLCNTI